MNDEIKEILDGFRNDIENNLYIEVRGIYYKPLLDYITNLQQEIERQSKAQVILDDMLVNYKQKNEELKSYYMSVVKVADKRLDRYLDYKSRCEKAIEILHNINDTLPLDIILSEVEHSEHILQNGSDKE